MGRVNNGEVDVHGLTVKQIISFAWDLNPNDSEAIVDAPKWLDGDQIRHPCEDLNRRFW